MITENTLCVVEVTTMHVYTVLNDDANKEEELEKANQYYIDDFEKLKRFAKEYPESEYWQDRYNSEKAKPKKYCKIMTFAEFQKAEREYLLSKELKEITEEVYHDMLNVLPPIKWTTRQGIEMFCMMEMYTGTYTSQYAHDKVNNKYYSKLVDCTDESTWIHNILRKSEV